MPANNALFTRKTNITSFDEKGPNYALIGIVAIFLLLAILVIIYVFSDWFKPGSVSKNTAVIATGPTTTTQPITVPGVNMLEQRTDSSQLSGMPEVFNIAENVFSYGDAEAVCKAYGAELATYDQLVDAYKKGANWCNYGWTKGQLKLYPIQKAYWDELQENEPDRRDDCGLPGINGGYEENKNMQYGVNCYGVKRSPTAEENLKQAYVSDKDRELMEKVARFKQQLSSLRLTPFNEDKWHSSA